MNTQNETTLTANTLINIALADITDVQDKLNNMLCLQKNIGSFMDDVMEMSPIKDMDSVMRVQIGRDDANCFTNVVIDYLLYIIGDMNSINNTLTKAFELSREKREEAEQRD